MNSVSQLAADVPIVRLPRRNDTNAVNDLVAQLSTRPKIVVRRHFDTTDYFYECNYSALRISKAFCFPLEVFHPNKRNSPLMVGRFKDLACMWSWVCEQRQHGQLPSDLYARLDQWFFKHYDCNRLNIGPRVRAPPADLLFQNGGTLNEQEWERLYRKPENFFLYKSLQQYHITAKEEFLLQEEEEKAKLQKNDTNMSIVDLPILSSSSFPPTVALVDKAVDQAVQDIDILTQNLPALDQPGSAVASHVDHKRKSSTPVKRKTPAIHFETMPTDIDMKPAAPAKKQKQHAEIALPSFSDFANSINHAPAVATPKAPAKPRAKKEATPAAAAGGAASVEDMMKQMQKLLAAQQHQQQNGTKKRAAISSSSSSSSSSVSPLAAAAPLALPPKKRVIHSQAGKQKKDTESTDFYHDLSKLFLQEPAFDLASGNVRRCGLWMVDKNGQLSLMTLSGQKKATVDLLDKKE